jgi:N-acetylneuraminate synthase
MDKVIKTLKSNADIDGSGVKTAAASEMFDRDWRADPSDGLRPLIKTRAML